ncbi:quinone-dependent dihydroorotate dehydrogenase [Sphingosinicella terrae]|uniref:quinone-dependent dihydroorotate dehydrogenase n=1 Tax=Sphingosinicella terrae TaxID=2172047 RepID=UPI000E0D1415|nr:quinone-dependent dihydroorotate dehydrogenase [Sphingosinicella terrae]
MALYPLIRPFAFALDAERAHRWTIAALRRLPPGSPARDDPVLATDIGGLHFPNPVGLAAGFDKDAEVFRQMLGFGFGFVEIGTLTPLPQEGNPRPRLFRLVEDRAVINRMGFNNQGQVAALARLRTRRRAGIVGVNIGANKDSGDRIGDYEAGVRAMAGVADFLTINISSPNTPGLRALQDKGALESLLDAVTTARRGAAAGAATRGRPPPVFLKVAPDLEIIDVDHIARAAIDAGIDGLIVSNTTVTRPPLRSRHRDESGGLSGAPLKDLALERLRDFRKATGGRLPLIAVGGIENGVDAFHRIRAGASLVQLYSALVYQGPELAALIAAELKRLLLIEGFAHVREAVGSEKRSE